MLKISESKTKTRFSLWELGFRPFFLGAAAFALISTLIWLGVFSLGWRFSLYGGISASTWHGHEMIFGYAMAVVAGFLLTAVGNWTGSQMPRGIVLVFIFLLWLVARILPFMGSSLPIIVSATVDNLFLFSLLVSTVVPVFRAKQWANVALVLIILPIIVANITFYLGIQGLVDNGVRVGLYAGMYLLLAIVLVMARRVVPFFIKLGIEKQEQRSVQLSNWQWLDVTSLIFLAVLGIVDIFLSDSIALSLIAVFLFGMHSLRLVNWYERGIWRIPLLWVLYLAYAFLVLGFALKSLGSILPAVANLATHAFTVGTIGMISIGMMARISLGHTGRNVFEPPKLVIWVFVTLLVATFIRVIVPLFAPSLYFYCIVLSQLFWIVSFSLFLYIYTPILVSSNSARDVN